MGVDSSVLVTAIGSFSSSAVLPNLARAGFRIVGCDIYPRNWIASSLEVDSFYQVPMASNEAGYIQAIEQIVRDESIDYIIPLTDYEVDVISPAREKISATSCISPKDAVSLCRDKRMTFKIVEQLFPDMAIPTYSAHEFRNDETLDVGVWVCKPCNGRSSSGLFKAKDRASALSYLESVDDDFIVQPLVPGDVVTVDIVRDPDRDSVIALARKELLRTPNGAGTSVYVFRDLELEERCREIAGALNVRGCVNFEFICTEKGSYHFLECNPRFAGGVSFSCAYGYDFVLNHLRCFAGYPIEGLERTDGQYIARRYTDYLL